MSHQVQQLGLINPRPLPTSPEFSIHTPQVGFNYSDEKKITFRRLIENIAEQIEPEGAPTTGVEQTEPSKIRANLIIPFEDPRRRKNVKTEQLVVARPIDEKKLRADSEFDFHFEFDTGVVFGANDFGLVMRAPEDFAKTVKAENRALTEKPTPSNEEEYELAIERNEFTAIRAAIHRLDGRLIEMADLAEATNLRREVLEKMHRFANFRTYAQYSAHKAFQMWGRVDAETHELIRLSLLNAPRPLYGLSQLHSGMKDRLYSPSGDVSVVDSFREVLKGLVGPYHRARAEKIAIAIHNTAIVRNQHMEELPPSMQAKVISDYADIYEDKRIRPVFLEFIEDESNI